MKPSSGGADQQSPGIHQVLGDFFEFSQAGGPTLLWQDALPSATNEIKAQEAA